RSYRAYIDWTPTPRVAAKLAYQLVEFEGAATTSDLVPNATTEHIAEAGLRFFDPSGFFSHVDIKYTNQRTIWPQGFGEPPAFQNEFVIVNVGIGYRLPKRFGILRLEVKNLFDEKFNFQSFGLREIAENNQPFEPDRTILAVFTAAW
ncbi:MAG: hypothetical protein ACREBC_39055, partial [Pyrinomonadaceae bacterium]